MTKYNQAFYDEQEQLSLDSARIILDRLFAHYHPTSVVDVGCGRGTWLAACRELGIDEFLGIDGTHVDKQRLRVSPERLFAHDLCRALHLERRFDLAMSLEVAEHLTGARADGFIADMTALSDVVLFSAAIPYQGGTGHVNENWPEYWADKFRRHDYVLVDLLRPELWDDSRIAFWYRQNVFLYVRRASLASLGFTAWAPGDMPLSAVHPQLFLWACTRTRPMGGYAFDADSTYWHMAARAYREHRTLTEHVSGYGKSYEVRFGWLSRLRTRLFSQMQKNGPGR